jgi:CxxC motif-containing protein (DUF1111 family)
MVLAIGRVRTTRHVRNEDLRFVEASTGPVRVSRSLRTRHEGNGALRLLDDEMLPVAVNRSLTMADQGKVELRLIGGQTLPVTQPPLSFLVSMAALCADSRLELPRHLDLSQRNAVALFGARLIDEIPEADIIAGAKLESSEGGNNRNAGFGRRFSLMVDSRIGRFGWKAQSPNVADFVRSACANELGLGNSGHDQPRPLFNTEILPCGHDLTDAQCSQLTACIASLPRPIERVPSDPRAAEAAARGEKLFQSVGCTSCHAADLGPVQGQYSDMLLHDMGGSLEGGGSYSGVTGVKPGEWRTPPLWGVADSAPYMHDGRAALLTEAILLHGGDSHRSAMRFSAMSETERSQLIAFLQTLRAPDTR